MDALNGSVENVDTLRSSHASAWSRSEPPSVSGGAERRAIVEGTLIAGVLDAVDGVVALNLAAGMNPVQVLQYIASGVIGSAAFEGGLPAAALGAVLHFFIASVASAVYVAAARRVSLLAERWFLFGAAYGVVVYSFMNAVVLPASAVPKAIPSIGLLLNGVIGHALFVGVPIAWAARRLAARGGN